MASGGQLDSHVTCEGGVLNASNNSPRFDINEFLKTPKDVNNMVNVDVGDQFFNLGTGFNMPAHGNNNNIAFNNNNNSNRRSRDGSGENQSDFSALLFDNKTGSPEAAAAAVAAYAEDTLNGELIAFDEIDADIAKDSFSLFSHDNSHVSYMINHGNLLPWKCRVMCLFPVGVFRMLCSSLPRELMAWVILVLMIEVLLAWSMGRVPPGVNLVRLWSGEWRVKAAPFSLTLGRLIITISSFSALLATFFDVLSTLTVLTPLYSFVFSAHLKAFSFSYNRECVCQTE